MQLMRVVTQGLQMVGGNSPSTMCCYSGSRRDVGIVWEFIYLRGPPLRMLILLPIDLRIPSCSDILLDCIAYALAREFPSST